MTASPAQSCILWAVENGALLRGLSVAELRSKGNSLVVQCNDSSSQDAPSLFVPTKLLLTLFNIRQFADTKPGFLQVLSEWSQRFSMTSRRAILLLMAWDLRHGSPWSTYLKALPAHIDSPIFWPQDQRLLLCGTSIDGVAEDKIGFLAAWLRYQQSLPNASQFTKSLTLDEILRYEMLVDSRALLSNEHDSCMVPVIDFANHSSLRPPLLGAQNAAWDMTSEGFTLTVLPGLSVSQEILFSYGKRGNGELLFKYGFIEEWQVLKGSRSITIELPYFQELGDVGEPSFRIGSDDDEDVLSAKDSQYVWLLALQKHGGVNWHDCTFRGVHFTKENIRETLLQSEEWPVYQAEAISIIASALSAQLMRLDESEQDHHLIDISSNTSSERLNAIDAVRDSERKTLQSRLRELEAIGKPPLAEK